MRILIIDSDRRAFEQLEKLLKELSPGARIVGFCESAANANEWLRSNRLPDLIFAAVELRDGLSFEIFRKLGRRVPVIFTCRHAKYSIDAFKANGIFYLIKPVKKENLREALEKYETDFLHCYHPGNPGSSNRYQRRFLVSLGQQLRLIKTEEIAYFYTENKIVYAVTFDSAKYVMEFTLERLEQTLDPEQFFRINRQFIINVSAIVKLTHASKSRFQVFLRPKTE